MYKYEKRYYMNLSEKTGFHKDILEKVHRLIIILDYINTHPETAGMLALKGGTAINLTVFNMPRLSVDIDMDFCAPVLKDEMLQIRAKINKIILKYLEIENYILLPKSKTYHSLDSWMVGYTNNSGNMDKIKVEINYSLREHIFKPTTRRITTDIFSSDKSVYGISTIELFAGKITALLNRATARDLYDVYNMIFYGIIDPEDFDILKKCVIFYKSISDDDMIFSASVIDNLTSYKIKTDLLPLLRKKDKFDLDSAVTVTRKFVENIIQLTCEEKEYIKKFLDGEFVPQLLFEDDDIISRVTNHPMVMWKCMNRKK